jgi:hypothetical protein
MKVEYLGEGNKDCPLIRIYGSNVAEALRFYELALRLSHGALDLADIKAIDGFRMLGCSLLLRIGRDEGIIRTRDASPNFLWSQKKASWEVVAGLIDPFTKPSGGIFHQWLTGKEALPGLDRSEIALVFTNDEGGRW